MRKNETKKKLNGHNLSLILNYYFLFVFNAKQTWRPTHSLEASVGLSLSGTAECSSAGSCGAQQRALTLRSDPSRCGCRGVCGPDPGNSPRDSCIVLRRREQAEAAFIYPQRTTMSRSWRPPRNPPPPPPPRGPACARTLSMAQKKKYVCDDSLATGETRGPRLLIDPFNNPLKTAGIHSFTSES